jgi:hypothetical protein
LQKRIIKHIPREKRAKTEKRAGIEGYGICKFHGMTYAAAIMLKVGCLLCVDAGKNEFLHKLFIKSHYNQTQRIADRFASQTAQGEYERVLLEKMDRHMMKYLPEEVRHITVQREDSIKWKGNTTTNSIMIQIQRIQKMMTVAHWMGSQSVSHQSVMAWMWVMVRMLEICTQ